jgi:hypothetical protein
MRKRKKGKLPKDATTALKTWWTSNLVWPYPSVCARAAPHVLESPLTTQLSRAQDDDKRTLGDETGLNATQINNCASRLRAYVHATKAHVGINVANRVHQPAKAPLAQGAPHRARACCIAH